jgi:hypothetical protein
MRAHAMNGDTRAEGADALAAHAEMNNILSKAKYTTQDKTKLVQLMKRLGIDKKDDGGSFVISGCVSDAWPGEGACRIQSDRARL